MKPKVFLTRELPPKAMEVLKEHTELEVNTEDRVLTKNEIIQGVQGKDALLCLLTDTIDFEIMDANPNLKVIANFAVGFNNIDIQAAAKRNILITNTPGVLTETTADMAFALLLSVARRVSEGDKFVRSKSWQGWGPLLMLGTDVYGATLGLIGLGSIGRSMIKRAKGFDMEVLYWNQSRMTDQEEKDLGISYVSFDEVMSKSDFVSLHVAYNKETHHLIGEKEFSLMKKNACIINTARGSIIDEKALVRALKGQTIGGAGLDVYENEPQLEPELYELDNAVLVPHLGSATIATRTKMALMAVENLLSVFNGMVPPNLVTVKE